jgi:hypothetical protein
MAGIWAIAGHCSSDVMEFTLATVDWLMFVPLTGPTILADERRSAWSVAGRPGTSVLFLRDPDAARTHDASRSKRRWRAFPPETAGCASSATTISGHASSRRSLFIKSRLTTVKG